MVAEVKQRVAIVSGGATLLGVAVVETFHNAGMRVVVADIDERSGRGLEERFGSTVRFFTTDIRDDAAIDACLDHTLDTFGRIDYFISMACSYEDSGLESTRAEWKSALDVTLIGGAIFAQKVVPRMRRESSPAVVFVSSTSGKVAQADCLVYGVAKTAILGLSRNLALLCADRGIRVNCVLPGWTWSTPVRNATGDNREKADAVGAPFHLIDRIVGAEEVAAAILFLCSEHANGVTGAELCVDGGYLTMGPEGKSNNEARLGQ